MSNIKFTKQYAQSLADNQPLHDTLAEDKAYVNGYMNALHKTNAEDVLNALKSVVANPAILTEGASAYQLLYTIVAIIGSALCYRGTIKKKKQKPSYQTYLKP